MENYNPFNDTDIIFVNMSAFEEILCERIELIPEHNLTTMWLPRQKTAIYSTKVKNIKEIKDIEFNELIPIIKSRTVNVPDIEYYETCTALTLRYIPYSIKAISNYEHPIVQPWMLITKEEADKKRMDDIAEATLETEKYNSEFISDIFAMCVKNRLMTLKCNKVCKKLNEVVNVIMEIHKPKTSWWKKLLSSKSKEEKSPSDMTDINDISYEEYKLSEEELNVLKQNILNDINKGNYGNIDLSTIENFKVEDQDSEEFMKKVEEL